MFESVQVAWQQCLQQWANVPQQRLVVANTDTVETLLLQQPLGGIWSDQYWTLDDLYQQIAQQTPNVPVLLTAQEYEQHVQQYMVSKPPLRILQSYADAHTVAHTILWLDNHTPGDWRPNNALQEAVYDCRQALSKDGLLSPAGWLRWLASHHLSLQLPSLLLAPMTLTAAQRMLLQSLDVSGESTIDMHYTELPTTTVAGQYLEVENELEAAVAQAVEWVQIGVAPADIAILHPQPHTVSNTLLELAGEWSLPCRGPVHISAASHPVTMHLARLARGEEQPSTSWMQYGDWDAWYRQRNDHDRWQWLYQHGLQLLQPEETDARQWLQRFHQQAPQPVEELFAVTVTLEKGTRDGVRILPVDALAQQPLQRVLLLGNNNDQEQQIPVLLQERAPQWMQRVVQQQPPGGDHVVALRVPVTTDGKQQLANRWWQIQQTRQGGEHRPRHQWQAAARQSLLVPQLAQAWQRRDTQRHLPEMGISQRQRYTVSELEAYQRCPAGWYVQYVLHAAQQSSPQAQRGTLLHGALAAAWQADPDHRLDRAQEYLLHHGQGIDTIMLRLLSSQINHLLVLYGEQWPLQISSVERTVAAEGILPDWPQVTLSGRIDRVDYDPNTQRWWTIDWKSRSRPLQSWQMQHVLYPLLLLADDELDDPTEHIGGGLFVGAVRGNAWGAARDRSATFADDTVDWDTQHNKVIDKAQAAIAGILAGEYPTGHNCPAWCPHHLLRLAS